MGDIYQILESESVDLADIYDDVPVDGDEEGSADIAIDVFDDESFEPRSPNEWLDLGRKRGKNYESQDSIQVPAICARRVDEQIEYEEAFVCGYDAQRSKYHVEFTSDNMRCRRARLLILFRAEDPWNYSRRIKCAIEERRLTLQHLAYNLYLDCMPVDNLPSISGEQMNRIVTRSISTKKMKVGEGSASGGNFAVVSLGKSSITLVDEINLEFSRAMNRCILDKAYSDNLKLPVASQNSILKSMRPTPLLKFTSQIFERPEGYKFEDARYHFTFNSFLTVPAVLNCVNKVKLECFRVATTSLFSYPIGAVRPEEFEQLQVSHREMVNKLLRETWVNSVRNAIQSSLKDIGKGWFNLQEHRMNVYIVSKLCKLMTQVKFIMQDSLKSLSDQSAESFARLFVGSLSYEVTIEDFDKVKNTPTSFSSISAKNDDSLQLGLESKRSPLFVLDLVLEPSGMINYNVELDVLFEMPLLLYDAAIEVMQGIPQLEPQILTNLFWPEKPNLGAPDSHDPVVNKFRELMAEALKLARSPLEQYLHALEPLQSVMALDVPSIIKQWETKTPEEIAAQLEVRRGSGRTD
eukprot:761318-Hanusia_phi.AAC.6